jgi:effector-binding domain-containing protein
VNPTNGYRFYSIEQLPELNRILALRDLGLSLEQIKRLMGENISQGEIKGMLKLKMAQIEQELQEEHSRMRRVASRLKQIEHHGTFPRHEVVIKEIPGQAYLSLREPVPFIRKSGWLYYQVSDAVIENKVPGLSYCMAVFHDPYFRERDVDFELGFLLDEPKQITIPLPEGRVMTVKQVEPIHEALTCVHTGPWPEIHLGFSAIGAYMEANQMRIAGRPREVYLNLVPPEQDEKLVVEIQIPVTSS